MIFKRVRRALLRICAVMMAPMAVNVSYGAGAETASIKHTKLSLSQQQIKQKQEKWKKLFDTARTEVKIVMYRDSSEGWRKALLDLFHKDYQDIKVEYTG